MREAEACGCGIERSEGESFTMKKNGGWYAGVTPEGDIVPNKQCYAHAFVILAASSALTAGRPWGERAP